MLLRHSPWLTTCSGMHLLNRTAKTASIAPKRPLLDNHAHSMRFMSLIVVGLMAACVSAADIKVSSAADLAAALPDVKAGDTLVMVDGAWFNQALVFKAAGTQAQPITLRPQTPGKVVLYGKSSLKIDGQYLVVSGLLFKDGLGGGD